MKTRSVNTTGANAIGAKTTIASANRTKTIRHRIIWISLSLAAQLQAYAVLAQDGGAALDQANQMLRGYFERAVPVMYAAGGLSGIIGAIKVYRVWVEGKHEAGAHMSAFIAACIFLVLAATVIRAFFGL
jgi:hypothetical protein